MIRAGVLWSLLLAPAAFGQLQLFVFDQGTERAITTTLDAGDVAPGDSKTLRVRARNLGSAAVTLQTISLAGAGFKIGNRPSLPYIVAPLNFTEFEIVFQPTGVGSYSAAAAANGISFLVKGTSSAAATVMQNVDGRLSVLASGSTIDFGRTVKGSEVTRTVVIGNSNTTAVTVAALSVSGAGFRLAATVGLPLVLAAGESRSFNLVFQPDVAQAMTGRLTVDQRTFALAGTGFDPPMPAISVSLDNAAAASAQQRRVALKLAGPAPTTGSGNLRMVFQSDVPGVTDDPAVKFLSTGGRVVTFTIREGDTQARFGSDLDVGIQTGTTAGKILFTVEMGPAGSTQAADLTVSLAKTPVAVESAQLTTRLSNLDVQVTGFDNSYEVGLLSFTFYDKAGRVLDPGVIRVDARAEFQTFFKAATAGSAFVLRASFPVSGDQSLVSGVEVELSNSAGTTKTGRLAVK